MKYTMLMVIPKVVIITFALFGSNSTPAMHLIIKGKIDRWEETENDERNIRFEASCIYYGNPGKIGIIKNIIDKEEQLYGEIVFRIKTKEYTTKLHGLDAALPFNQLSGMYIDQNPS